jgi:DNA-binding beta-propeller fold protein YncE
VLGAAAASGQSSGPVAFTQAAGTAGCIAAPTNTAGCAVAPGLSGPTAAVVRPDGAELVVASHGSNRLVVLTRSADGGLAYSSCLGAMPPCRATPGLRGVARLAESANGRLVLALSPSAHTLVLLRRASATGRLAFVDCLSASGAPKGCHRERALAGAADVAVTADGAGAYVATDAGVVGLTLSATRRGAAAVHRMTGPDTCLVQGGHASSALRGCGRARAVAGAAAITMLPSGRALYLAVPGAGRVVALRRDRHTGRLSPLACVATQRTRGCSTTRGISDASEALVSGDGTNLYVAGPRDRTVTEFSLGPDDRPEKLSCLSSDAALLDDCVQAANFTDPTGLGLSPVGRSVYVTDPASGFVSAFIRSTDFGGTLVQYQLPGGCMSEHGAEVGCAQGRALLGAVAVVASPDRRTVYVVAQQADAIAVLRRDVED